MNPGDVVMVTRSYFCNHQNRVFKAGELGVLATYHERGDPYAHVSFGFSVAHVRLVRVHFLESLGPLLPELHLPVNTFKGTDDDQLSVRTEDGLVRVEIDCGGDSYLWLHLQPDEAKRLGERLIEMAHKLLRRKP